MRVRTAEGEEQRRPARAALLTCGAWSAQLVRQLLVFPVMGQMLSLQGPRQELERVVFGPGTYLVPRSDGLLVEGAISEPEAGFGEGLTPAGQRQLQAGLEALLPEAAQWPPMERWKDFRPCTPDHAPLPGTGPLRRLWLATGHHRNGVLVVAVAAQLLGNCLAPEAQAESGIEAENGEPELLTPFRWDRFSGG